MITNVYSYFSLLILFITGILYCQKTLKLSIFKFIPGLTFIYFGGMIGASLHIWELNSEISSFIGSLKYYLLPMMLFLLLLKNDIRDVFKLGPKLIGTFFAVTASILIGFIIVYVFFKHKLDPEAWQTFAILSSSWVGGSTNMAATQAGLGVLDSSQALTYAFLMDNICASFWLVLLITFAPMREKFNKFSGANSKEIDKIISHIHFNAAKNENKRDYEFMDFMLTLGLGLGVAGIVLVIGKQLINPGNLVDGSFLKPLRTFFSGSGWVVIVATVFGLLGSMTPLKKIKGTDHVGNVLLYVVVGLIATATDFSTISFEDAAIYIIGGFLILLFHLIVLLILARVFKLDLYICGIASQANIGGTVSAPILAGTYDEALIPAGLMMGILGTSIGTITALLLGKILILL
ncbi:Uncharacterized membrane protein [Cetobacterium ceti]|uniref:Uncharacterized membrane protein n=1 Tax=Cetobacterium ceti TaxID=180163 RepID=A0A1T4MEI9_9FUSO|nr:DUF819 family protein [Cetobacterium ceti]SJZ65449.1 Uncharacterized membrane protein [Cetobacterium ceti]